MKCPHCGRETDTAGFALDLCERKNGNHRKSADRLVEIGDGEEFIRLPIVKGEAVIRKSAVSGWEDVYSSVDVPLTLKQIREWILANPTKKKVNVRAFVVNWLNREQDR